MENDKKVFRLEDVRFEDLSPTGNVELHTGATYMCDGGCEVTPCQYCMMEIRPETQRNYER